MAHGINLPLSALRTKNSSNIGKFFDLLPLIDWCKEVGFEVIQLLPLNQTESDPSPYNISSSCALNPIYLSDTMDRIEPAGLQRYVEENPWLLPFDAFRRKNGHKDQIMLQYLCYLQMKEVKAYATERGIKLMGDIPFFVSANSADVMAHPNYFDTSHAAGAPPDMYNPEGQYWGFPLFRWEEMKKDNYSWWKQRLEYASHFFHIYRLDHILGFFRVWGIPLEMPSQNGRFFPTPEGKAILKTLINSTSMIPIGEDLGAVPPMVPPILQELGICSTKVLRWAPKRPYPHLSLTTVSTHDSTPLGPLSAQMREKILWESHHTESLYHVNLLSEYLALFPELVHPNPDQERINIPGTVLPTNWTYRFIPTVEEIVSHQGLRAAIAKILAPRYTPPI